MLESQNNHVLNGSRALSLLVKHVEKGDHKFCIYESDYPYSRYLLDINLIKCLR